MSAAERLGLRPGDIFAHKRRGLWKVLPKAMTDAVFVQAVKVGERPQVFEGVNPSNIVLNDCPECGRQMPYREDDYLCVSCREGLTQA